VFRSYGLDKEKAYLTFDLY